MPNDRAIGQTFAPENWLPIEGFEGLYEVSDLGRVRSLGKPSINGIRSFPQRILRPGPSNYGHLSVVLGRRNTRMVHTLVLQAFVGPRPPGMECRHLDGDPKNNRLDNLCWGTRSENIHDAVKHGTWHSKKRIAGWNSPAMRAARAKGLGGKTPGALAALETGRQIRRWHK